MKKLMSIVMVMALLLSLSLAVAEEQKVYKVGIGQFAVHGSLDNCREGFIQGMQEQGFEEGVNVSYDYQNAQASMDYAVGIANKFVAEGQDLIVAIATPMAVVSMNAADDKIPVIYTAVSFPQSAGLSDDKGVALGNTTGTSDQLPVGKQLASIRALQPEAKVIGILYTLGEVNSVLQVEEYQRLAPEQGFTIEAMGISAGSEVALAIPALLSKVDLVTMTLDNTVVQYLDNVLEAADAAKIPVYGSEIEQVKRGCVSAEGLDYVALGRQTGALAARVLNGEDAATIPYEIILNSELYYNASQILALGLSLPDSFTATGLDVSQTN